jgi:D-threo-aldose 1-dehydrogenase
MMAQDSLPTIGLGCAPLGNLFHARTDEDAAEILEAAWQAGVRHYDTAPLYGLGLSEIRLGRFLADKPRNEYVVSTKVGRLIRPNCAWDGVSMDDQAFDVPAQAVRVWDFTPAGVRSSLEESLERLDLDRIDIAYLHDPEHSGAAGAVRDGLSALADLRAEGLTDEIGTGSMTAPALLESVRTGLADLIMVAGRYTLLDQTVHPDVLEACSSHGTGIVAAAVFNSGLLSGVPSAFTTYDYLGVPEPILKRAQAIHAVCVSYDVELPTAAMKFPLLDPRVRSVVVGADTPGQVRQNVARMAVDVPDELWAELNDRGLVPRCI